MKTRANLEGARGADSIAGRSYNSSRKRNRNISLAPIMEDEPVGDMGDIFNDMKEYKKKLRAAFGVPCPQCNVKEPKRTPSVLLPGQTCRVDGYVDPRPRLTREQKENLR